jgi:hypothetical protein
MVTGSGWFSAGREVSGRAFAPALVRGGCAGSVKSRISAGPTDVFALRLNLVSAAGDGRRGAKGGQSSGMKGLSLKPESFVSDHCVGIGAGSAAPRLAR